MRDVRKKLDDLAHEIRTVGIPLAELVYNKQKNVSIDINDLSKAGSEAGLKKISYRQTGLIKQIQFSEAEAWQKGAVEGQDEAALDKAPHEKIAWFIKNAAPMAKAREIIKSHNAMQKEVKDAGLDPNHGHFLFANALRNSAFQQFKQDDDNEAHFIKDINIELWNIYRDNEKAQEFFGKENMATTDYFLRNEIIYELLKTEQHTAESIDFGEKLLYFPGADTAPVAVLNAYRESGRSGERPFLSIHRKSEESELFKFIMKLDERQLEIIKQKNIPGLYEIITAVKANPTTFNSQSIKNPDITKFTEELKNDEEFLDYVGEQSFPPVEKFEIIRQEAKNKETGEEEWEHHYDPATNEYRIGEKRLKELLPDIQLNYDTVSIKKDDPLFNEIKRALAKDSLKEHDIKPSAYSHNWGEFVTRLGTDEKYYSCPEEKIVYFLEKQNYSKHLFNNPEVSNQLYDEIQQNLVKMSDYYLKSDEPDMKFYLMDLLEKLDADLNGVYVSLSKILTGPPDYRMQKQTVDCLVARIDRYNACDKKALATILTGYEQALNVRKDIEQKTPQFINLLLREPYKFNQEEKEYFGKLLGKVIDCPPAEITRTVNFLIQIREAGSFLYCSTAEDIKSYIALARNPAMLPFIKELLKDDFSLVNIKQEGLFQEIYENRALVLPAAKKLREYNIQFDLGRNFTQIKDIAENDLLDLFEQFKDNKNSQKFIFYNGLKLGAISKERRKDYLEIFLKIDESPSQEIQRLKDQLLKGLLGTDNPIGSYEKINDIFIKNNLPTVGKVFKVFAVLHKPDQVKGKLSNGSPVLTQTKSQRRLYDIFYRDLLKIHIASGNRSLRQYCEILKEDEKILNEAEAVGVDGLTYAQTKKLEHFFDKINTLFVNSALGRNFEVHSSRDKKTLSDEYQNLRQSLGCKSGQKITERISQMFLRPVGLDNLDDVLNQMREAKETANARGMKYAGEAGESALEIQAGDLLKVVDANYIENILQNGSVAKEFLGPAASSDSTPFDTDVTRLQKEVAEQGFRAAVSQSKAIMGELLFCVKDRGQFDLTERKRPAKYNSQKLELFVTGGGNHYGIRTGFPTTEIDFMIAEDSLWQNKRKFSKICYEIAQNGWYIPIADTSGKIIFTPEIYGEYRKIFDGLERFDGNKFEFIPADENESSYRPIQEIIKEKQKDEKNIRYLSDTIKETLREVFESLSIAFKDEFSTSIIGAEFLNIGSTGRGTNLPGDYDFDFTLKLDAHDFNKAAEIAGKLREKFVLDEKSGKDESHSEAGGYYQLKVSGITEIDGRKFEHPLNIDIGFAKKSDLMVFGSHDAIKEKLDSLEKYSGKKAREEVIANIILDKKILSQGEAYKKTDGGFGGVGVENWILANHGNIKKAFASFYNVAHENSEQISLDKFKEKYKLLDAGVNIKKLFHDNYIENLTEEGYKKMIKVIYEFLAQNL